MRIIDWLQSLIEFYKDRIDWLEQIIYNNDPHPDPLGHLRSYKNEIRRIKKEIITIKKYIDKI